MSDPAPPPQARVFRAWILFFLVATIGGAVAGAIATGILHFLLSVAGVSVESIHFAAAWARFVVALPISYGAFRWAVLHLCLPSGSAHPASSSVSEPR